MAGYLRSLISELMPHWMRHKHLEEDTAASGGAERPVAAADPRPRPEPRVVRVGDRPQ